MEYTIEFVEGQVPDVLVSISGPMTIEGNRAWMGEVVHDDRWAPGMKTLVDATELLPAEFHGDDVHQVAMTTVVQADEWGAGASAVIVTSPAVYGLLRIWQVATSDMEWKTELFDNRYEALNWLRDG